MHLETRPVLEDAVAHMTWSLFIYLASSCQFNTSVSSLVESRNKALPYWKFYVICQICNYLLNKRILYCDLLAFGDRLHWELVIFVSLTGTISRDVWSMQSMVLDTAMPIMSTHRDKFRARHFSHLHSCACSSNWTDMIPPLFNSNVRFLSCLVILTKLSQQLLLHFYFCYRLH